MADTRVLLVFPGSLHGGRVFFCVVNRGEETTETLITTECIDKKIHKYFSEISDNQ